MNLVPPKIVRPPKMEQPESFIRVLIARTSVGLLSLVRGVRIAQLFSAFVGICEHEQNVIPRTSRVHAPQLR